MADKKKNRNKKNNISNVKKTNAYKKEEQELGIMDEFKIIKKNMKESFKKFKTLSRPIRILIIVFVLCSILLIFEGIAVMLYDNDPNKNVVFHDSYTGVSIDNNVILAGNSDFKTSSLENYTKRNVRGKLIKLNNNGDIIFEKVYEKGIATTFNSVISVKDGYVVVGTGIFSEEEEKNDGREAIIIKYDKDGNVIWEKYYQVITDTKFNKVIETSDGYIAVGQSIYANMQLGNHTTGGGIIVKYDKDGNEIWHNNHGGTKSGNFNDLVVVNNDIYVVGKDGPDSGNIVKFNSNGEYLWHKNYSYTDSFGFGGIVYADGGLYVVGSKKVLPEGVETKSKADRATSNTDALLIKYDLDGNIVFEKTFGGSSFERYNSIIMYHNNFYVVGHICSKDAGVRVTNDRKDEMTGLIVRYDINGNILRKETFGGSNNDNLTGIVTDGTSYYAVGYSNSKDGNLRTSRSNGKDYFGKLIKLNSRFRKIYVK